MSSADGSSKPAPDNGAAPAFLIFDAESIPDGRLLALIKYPDDHLSSEDAVHRAQQEARERSATGSDFLPVTFQYPIGVCVVRVGSDLRIQAVTSLDAPLFRTREIVAAFWRGVALYSRAKLVTFNGRAFDLPLMEMAAFRYGCSAQDYYQRTRHRFNGHLDLCDWLANYGACRHVGGLNLLSKLLGKPGKMEITGDQVYEFFRAGRVQDINDYCMFDTLDTYFVFLRTRVLTGDLTLENEHELVAHAHGWLSERANTQPALRQYLANWGDWDPWP